MKVQAIPKTITVDQVQSLIVDGNPVHVADVAKEFSVEKITDVYDLIHGDPNKTFIVFNRFWINVRPPEEVKSQKERISNKTLIPLIKTAAQDGDLTELTRLKESYPEIYESSIKYIGKRLREKVEALYNGDDATEKNDD